MHICTVILMGDRHSKEDLCKLLDKYCEDSIDFESTKDIPIVYWDYWVIGGRYSGNIKAKNKAGYITKTDSAAITDICNLDEIECYAFIDPKGNAHAREAFDWDNEEFIQNPNFDDEFKNAIHDPSVKYIYITDWHD